MSDIPSMRPYGHHLLICTHGDCADPEEGVRLQRHFQKLAHVHGLSKLRNPRRVKCTLTDCLGVCSGGPIVAVYPEGIWYHHVDEAALERIVREHILGGQPVEELIFHRLETTTDERSRTADDEQPAADETKLHSTPEAQARRAAVRKEKKRKGLVIVHTGKGKGKTTAALGILMRAWGRDMRLGGIQFFKHENANFGELRSAQKMGIDLVPMGDGFTWTSRDMDETQAKALHGWEVAKQRIASGAYDIFLLDEFTYVLHFGWLDVPAVVGWLRDYKPPMMHVIITGRDAPQELIDFADLVTEMREITHPFHEQGIKAQPGIEF